MRGSKVAWGRRQRSDHTDVPTCTCKHAASLHCPGGDLSATDERGSGECTAGPWGMRCACERFVSRHHPSVTGRVK